MRPPPPSRLSAPAATRPSTTDKRLATRTRRRLLVRMDRSVAFTIDVSGSGLCIGTRQVLPVNSLVVGSVQVEGDQVPFSGRVAWAIAGDSRLNLPGKMGVALHGAGTQLARFGETSSLMPAARARSA